MTLIKDSKIDFSQPDIYTGILKPNSYTDVELAAIVNPQEGWLAENSDDNSLQRYNGTAWVDIGGGTPAYGGYEALVGPNQTYKSVNEALGDNKYIIAVVEDVTENDVVLAQAGTLFIRIDLFATWTCNQGMDFQSLSVVEELEINGSAKGRLVINMTGGQNGDCIEMTAGKYVFLHNLYIQNSGTAINPFPGKATAYYLQASNIYYIHNNPGQEFYIQGLYSQVTNLSIVAGATTAGQMIEMASNAQVTNLSTDGAMDASNTYANIGALCMVNNWMLENQQNENLAISIGGIVTNSSFNLGMTGKTNITITSTWVIIENLNTTAGDFTAITKSFCNLINVIGMGGTGTWTANNLTMTNCYGLYGISLSGESCLINHNDITQGFTGGAQTYTFTAASKNCMCIGNLVQSAVVNSGTNNTIANNSIVAA